MKKDLLRQFELICSTKIAEAGYTSGLCGEWNKERFTLLGKELNHDPEKMIMANQHHTDKVKAVKEEEAGSGVSRPLDDNYADALVTDQKGLLLSVHTADCVPVVFLEPLKKVVAVAHSGWVGTAKCITAKTVKRMVEEYGCNPEHILCAIGPYNHVCCYEVGEDVREAFKDSFSDSECEIFFQKKKEEGKYMLDLGSAISLSLQKVGVKKENIDDEDHCTFHTTDFSSWRRTGNKKHQILTYIMLK